MTLQEARDQIAKKHGFEKWIDVLLSIHTRAYTSTFHMMDEAAELYARSKAEICFYEGIEYMLDEEKVCSKSAYKEKLIKQLFPEK